MIEISIILIEKWQMNVKRFVQMQKFIVVSNWSVLVCCFILVMLNSRIDDDAGKLKDLHVSVKSCDWSTYYIAFEL